MKSPLICAAVVTLLGVSANGYVRQASNFSTGQPLFRTDNGNIAFLVNTSIAPGFTNSDGQIMITSDSNPLSALTDAEQAWEDVQTARVHFQALAVTTLQNDPSDGKCVMTIADTPENRSIVGDYLAVTAYTYAADAAITDTDIIFNPAILDSNGNPVPFSTDQEWNSYDLRSVATHELGHALGADHSGIVGSTMNFATSPIGSFANVADATVQSSLSTDDEAFVADTYPTPESGAQAGIIKGTVAFSNGSPILGGLVVATDIYTGVTVGGLTSLIDGTYVIAPVPPGNYLVYAQPLDGPVDPANLSIDGSLVTGSFRTTFAGGNASPWFVSVAESGTGNADISVDPAPSELQITWLGVGSAGGMDWSYATVKTVLSGDSADVLLWGPNLSSTVTESQLKILGPGVGLVPGSLKAQASAAVNGLVPLRFTVKFSSARKRVLISVGIVNGTDAAIRSGGLVMLPEPALGQLTLPPVQ